VPATREPALVIPLRFGTYRSRYLLALGLLFAGGILLQFSSAYTLGLTLAGAVATIAGWIVVPAPGWRRALVAGPALFGVIALIGGAESGGLLAITLGAWLIVRMRPLVSFVVLVAPVTAAYGLARLFPEYGYGAVVGGVLGLVLVGSAWLARMIAAAPFAQRRISTHGIRTIVP
jgi:hypothetical protein